MTVLLDKLFGGVCVDFLFAFFFLNSIYQLSMFLVLMHFSPLHCNDTILLLQSYRFCLEMRQWGANVEDPFYCYLMNTAQLMVSCWCCRCCDICLTCLEMIPWCIFTLLIWVSLFFYKRLFSLDQTVKYRYETDEITQVLMTVFLF